MISKPGQARWKVAGATVILLATVLFFWKTQDGQEIPADRAATTPAGSGNPPPRPDSARNRPTRELPLADLPALPAPQRPPHPPGSADNRDWIDTTITTLDTLAWEDDAESMRKILAELRSPEPEIRAAALEATRDFDDPAAIRYLRAISNDTVDPLEQKEIAELIKHLQLPSLIETLEESPPTPEPGR
jgi:hypothetical protein